MLYVCFREKYAFFGVWGGLWTWLDFLSILSISAMTGSSKQRCNMCVCYLFTLFCMSASEAPLQRWKSPSGAEKKRRDPPHREKLTFSGWRKQDRDPVRVRVSIKIPMMIIIPTKAGQGLPHLDWGRWGPPPLHWGIDSRVFQKKTFLKLSFCLLTTHAIGL